jgi:tRNA-intron endonuclease
MAIFLKEDRIIVDDETVASRLLQKAFGRKTGTGGMLELSLIEGLYLISRGSIKVMDGEREVTQEDIIKIAKEEDFQLKYKVYADLRERGYIVKSGFKFGAHFRVYERGEALSEHSRYLVHAVPESDIYSFHEVSRTVRLAHGVKKDILFAVVDDEGDITYYKIERITP